METWYAVYDTTSGELVSIGTVLPDDTDDPDEVMPEHLESVALGDFDEQPQGQWNPVTKTLDPIPEPAPDPDKEASETIQNTPGVRTKLRSVVRGEQTFTNNQERDRVIAFIALKLMDR